MSNLKIQRKLGRQPVTYRHASFKPFLERTYGVPLYQEHMMKIGMVATNLTDGITRGEILRLDNTLLKQLMMGAGTMNELWRET